MKTSLSINITFVTFIVLPALLNFGCVADQNPATDFENPPEWSKEAIWYQIFVERFNNGDSTNDPTLQDIQGSYPGEYPENWATTPWTQDWYSADVYWDELEDITDFFGNELSSFGQKAQLRRYGGDLQGVLDKIDYLDSLGVTAIYFNPLNDAPSLHKFDARNWHHIDRNFGPTPWEDVQMIASENPLDPNTWQWTGADKLFLDVIEELHKRDMKVILDYSFNHTGIEFWAWKDIQENQQESEYADWFFIDEFDDPSTPENEFEYVGWAGVYSLPEIKETYRADHSDGVFYFEANIANESTKQHIFDVTKRWLDPNGDGDPSDGVDGYRLDVAAEVGLEFWREFRSFVRNVNPDAYLLGEIWWEKYPDQLIDPEPTLRGDIFDAPMNYRWYRSTRQFFNQAPDRIPVSVFIDSLNSYSKNVRPQNNYAMMNLMGSHDTPRFSTSVYNKNKYMYQAKPADNPDYKIDQPDAETFENMELMLAHQFTYVGAPQIWNGDEMGMWGANDPSSRKPLIWPEFEFETETTHPLGAEREADPVSFNHEWFDHYRKLIHIRTSNSVLSFGELEYLIIDDRNEILAYSRFDEENEVIAVFNTSNRPQNISIPKKFDLSYSDVLNNFDVRTSDSEIIIELPARSAGILVGE